MTKEVQELWQNSNISLPPLPTVCPDIEQNIEEVTVCDNVQFFYSPAAVVYEQTQSIIATAATTIPDDPEEYPLAPFGVLGDGGERAELSSGDLSLSVVDFELRICRHHCRLDPGAGTEQGSLAVAN